MSYLPLNQIPHELLNIWWQDVDQRSVILEQWECLARAGEWKTQDKAFFDQVDLSLLTPSQQSDFELICAHSLSYKESALWELWQAHGLYQRPSKTIKGYIPYQKRLKALENKEYTLPASWREAHCMLSILPDEEKLRYAQLILNTIKDPSRLKRQSLWTIDVHNTEEMFSNCLQIIKQVAPRELEEAALSFTSGHPLSRIFALEAKKPLAIDDALDMFKGFYNERPMPTLSDDALRQLSSTDPAIWNSLAQGYKLPNMNTVADAHLKELCMHPEKSSTVSNGWPLLIQHTSLSPAIVEASPDILLWESCMQEDFSTPLMRTLLNVNHEELSWENTLTSVVKGWAKENPTFTPPMPALNNGDINIKDVNHEYAKHYWLSVGIDIQAFNTMSSSLGLDLRQQQILFIQKQHQPDIDFNDFSSSFETVLK